jgi:hypothetical protein
MMLFNFNKKIAQLRKVYSIKFTFNLPVLRWNNHDNNYRKFTEHKNIKVKKVRKNNQHYK